MKQQPIGRVSHVVFRVEPDHLDELRDLFLAIGAEPFELVDDPELGLRVWVSFDSGIEIIAPVYETGRAYAAVRAVLDQHGEGFHNLVFGVADLEAAATAAASVGVAEIRRVSFTGSPRWEDQFVQIEELMLAPLHGVPVVPAVLEPRPQPVDRSIP